MKKCHDSLPLTHSKSGADPKFMKLCTDEIQSKFTKIPHSPDPVQSKYSLIPLLYSSHSQRGPSAISSGPQRVPQSLDKTFLKIAAFTIQ